MKLIGLQSKSGLLRTGLSVWLGEHYQCCAIQSFDEIAPVDLLIYERRELGKIKKPKIHLLFDDMADYPITVSSITAEVTKTELMQAVQETFQNKVYIQPILLKRMEEFYKRESVFEQLNQRDKILIMGILHGKRNKELAQTLYISEKTVKNNLTQLYKTLQVCDRRELEKKYKKLLTQKDCNDNI